MQGSIAHAAVLLATTVAILASSGCTHTGSTGMQNRYAGSLPPTPRPQRSDKATVKLHVLPGAFSRESRERYPDFVNKLRQSGWGNGIWQRMEDILYDDGRFDIIVEPPTNEDRIRHILAAHKQVTSEGEIASVPQLPDHILTINTNFFVRTNTSLAGFTAKKEEQFHSTVHLRYYEVNAATINTPVPATGDAVSTDLLEASRFAAEKAAAKLIRRLDRSW